MRFTNGVGQGRCKNAEATTLLKHALSLRDAQYEPGNSRSLLHRHRRSRLGEPIPQGSRAAIDKNHPNPIN